MIGSKIKCINNQPLKGNDVAPPLVVGDEYTIQDLVFDSEGFYHYDVGLKSNYNWINSIHTNKPLPHGDKIHWCHPSRFEAVEINEGNKT